MKPLTDLIATNHAFAALAAAVDADAPVRNETWSNAGAMIDHLGNIQGWVTEIVRTGASADREQYTRPPERERVEWFRHTSDALVELLETTDPTRACRTLWGAAPTVLFWRQRMTHEAAKHLWDLRTAIEPDPLMPKEIGLDVQADIIDEFTQLLVPTARNRGIDPLPDDVLLVAKDLDRTWRFSRAWEVTPSPRSGTSSKADSEVLRADVGDLALFVWGRANPWHLRDRFTIEGADAALQSFSRTPIHL